MNTSHQKQHQNQLESSLRGTGGTGNWYSDGPSKHCHYYGEVIDISTLKDIDDDDCKKLASFIDDVDEAFEAAKENNETREVYRLARLQGAARERLKGLRMNLNANLLGMEFEGGSRCKFRFESIQPAHVIPDDKDIVAGTVVTIARYEPSEQWTVPMYIRQHLVKQFRKVISFYGNPVKTQLYVSGAPGCGKTCFFWMWACMLMKQHNRVLFIQYRKEASCAIWVLEDGVMKQLASHIPRRNNLANVLDNLLEEQTKGFGVCILDGVRKDDMKCDDVMEVLDCHTNRTISKLVFVTSFPFFVNHGDESGGATRMAFDSWQEADYLKAAESELVDDPVLRNMLLNDWKKLTIGKKMDHPACNNATATEAGSYVASLSELTDAEKILEAFILKYDLAGGSARFMFQWNVDALKERLIEVLDRVVDWSVFTKTSIAAISTSDAALNSLMQQFLYGTGRGVCVAVSRYVLLRAYERCRTTLTSAVVAVARTSSNETFKGWALELKQKDVIYSALGANGKTRSIFYAATMTAVQNSKMTFIPRSEAKFDGSTIVKGEVVNGSVIWCSNPNPGLFDTAFYFDKTLVTLQFLAKPNINLAYLRSLRSALTDEKGAQVNRVVHLNIVDNQRSDQFKQNEIGGKACAKTFHGFTLEEDHSGELEQREQWRLCTSWKLLSTTKPVLDVKL